MNRFISISALVVCLLGTMCGKDDADIRPVTPPHENGQGGSGGGSEQTGIPEGYFEVVYSAPDSRGAVTGADGRVRDIRYLLFKSDGTFVKERQLVTQNDAVTTWPLTTIRDTLPKGSYRAVFLGNVQKTLFPYATSGSSQNYAEVLTGYQTGYASGRILLPAAEFSDTSEYYLANVTFSDANPNPYILLQRIISMLNVHRNFVDAQTALNGLVANIISGVAFKDQIRLQVQNTLPGLIRAILDKGALNDIVYGLIGTLDQIVSGLVSVLVAPVTDALYNLVLQQLVNQIGLALTGNADQQGLLAFLGVLLNPWAVSEAHAAIVTINDFPKSVDFGLAVQEKYTGLHQFKFQFTTGSIYDEKDILIKGFHGLFDMREINVVKQGLVAGLVMDDIVDGPWLLNGTFIDIEDPLTANVLTNYRYMSDYSFLDLGLTSYDPQTQSPKPLSVTVNLGSVPNLDGIVKGLPLLGPILNTTINALILTPLKTINVTVPVNLPLLSTSNLKLSGGWSSPTTY